MNSITEIANSNKLLSSDDNLAIYMVLLVANSDNERLDVNEIIEKVEKNYNISIDYNKAWRILKKLEEEGVVDKRTKLGDGKERYFLKEIIYSPALYTPIPNYLLVLIMLFIPVISYLILYDNGTIWFLISLTSFITVISILILHYFIFEVFKLKYGSIYTKRKLLNSLRVFLDDKFQNRPLLKKIFRFYSFFH